MSDDFEITFVDALAFLFFDSEAYWANANSYGEIDREERLLDLCLQYWLNKKDESSREDPKKAQV